ncbi:TetR/AcrR family transcriptional regulator [Nocardia sp. NPDC051570]|uniref:TetR/AcrR family transcriptional regulator n=1 Tax=Nocardia sp. NPDC051570 TaxID=3364324 RepID=UPI00378A05AC
MASKIDIPPAQRLLETASHLFYTEGIQAVGVERLIAEAGVTKATFYRHYPSKDDLVVAYLGRKDQGTRTALLGAAGDLPPRDGLYALFTAITAHSCGPGFRGCPFINAASEYPNPDHPVRRAAATHRAWLHATLSEFLTATGHPEPDLAAQQLVFLRDGILVGGYLDAAEATESVVRATVRTVIGDA